MFGWWQHPPGAASIFTCPSSLYPCVLSSFYEDWVIGFRVHSKPRTLSSQDSSLTASAKSPFYESLSGVLIDMKWGALFYIAQYSTVPRKVSWKQDEDRES